MVPRSSLKEGKNNQMVEKGTKTPNQPKPNTKARRPKLHHLVVFPLHWVKRVKRRLVAINGPEFSREKGRQRKLCSWKAASEASNGLSVLIIGDQRPHHSVAKQGHFAGQASRDAPKQVVIRSAKSDKIRAAIRGKDHTCSTTCSTGGAYKASHMLPDKAKP